MTVITVLLADDHPIVLQGLRHLLEGNPEFRVVGEAGDGIEAIRLVELLKPDILVVDMVMPGVDGLEVLRQSKKLSPATHIIVLSMQSVNAYVVEALNLGADGYVLKETGPGELINAIYAIIQGEHYISEKLTKRLESTGRKLDEAPLDSYQTLTSREREILHLTADGKSSTEIGDILVISPRTVEAHRSNLMKKLALDSIADLIKYSIKRGIIRLDE